MLQHQKRFFIAGTPLNEKTDFFGALAI